MPVPSRLCPHPCPAPSSTTRAPPRCRLLRQAGQRVELAEDADDGLAGAERRDERRGDAGDARAHLNPGRPQLLLQQRAALLFLIADLGEAPDLLRHVGVSRVAPAPRCSADSGAASIGSRQCGSEDSRHAARWISAHRRAPQDASATDSRACTHACGALGAWHTRSCAQRLSRKIPMHEFRGARSSAGVASVAAVAALGAQTSRSSAIRRCRSTRSTRRRSRSTRPSRSSLAARGLPARLEDRADAEGRARRRRRRARQAAVRRGGLPVHAHAGEGQPAREGLLASARPKKAAR